MTVLISTSTRTVPTPNITIWMFALIRNRTMYSEKTASMTCLRSTSLICLFVMLWSRMTTMHPTAIPRHRSTSKYSFSPCLLCRIFSHPTGRAFAGSPQPSEVLSRRGESSSEPWKSCSPSLRMRRSPCSQGFSAVPFCSTTWSFISPCPKWTRT